MYNYNSNNYSNSSDHYDRNDDKCLSSSCGCGGCFKNLFKKIQNKFRGNKYKTKQKSLHTQLILGNDL